jgi:putative ABC transport system permease protein/lipoprotein-releasing system permease protein
MRNPLAPATFLIRNKGKSIPLIVVVMLAVMLVMGLVSMMNSIPLSIQTIYSYGKYSVAVSPRGDPSMTPKIVDKIRKKCPYPIERIILCRASGTQVKSIVGKWPFVVFGMQPNDWDYYLRKLGSTGLVGRLPDPTKPEAIISRPIAENLDLKIGSDLQNPATQESYSPFPVKVVGIAQTDEWLILNGFEYQQANHFPPVDNVLVFAKDMATQDKVDHWVRDTLKGERAQVFAFYILEKQTAEMFKILYRLLDVIIWALALVITFMMGLLMNIYVTQRMIEFGLLQALGFTKQALLRRVLSETGIVLLLGWSLGVLAAVGLLKLAKVILMDPNAFALNIVDPIAIRYTLPIPFAIAVVAGWTLTARFRQFDPVGVVERRVV